MIIKQTIHESFKLIHPIPKVKDIATRLLQDYNAKVWKNT